MTGHDLLKYLEETGAAGRLDDMTVSTYKTACRAVLATLPAGLDTRLDRLELGNAQKAFEASDAARTLATATRSTYMSSFKAATRAALGATDRRPGDRRAAPAMELDDAGSQPFVVYSFPLRAAREAKLELPRNLQASEAERLTAFIRSLVIEPHD